MYKVFIVDDEKGIRCLLQHIIEWEKYNLCLAGMAGDGITAYDMILQEKPDIVIADVQMGGMTGLELIEKLQETLPHIHYIIISGYQFFEYAKAAIKFGVEDFLVKPINKRELNEALKKVAAKLESSDSNIISEVDYEQYKQAQQNKLLGDLKTGVIVNSFETINSKYAFDNIVSPACFITAAIDSEEEMQGFAQSILLQTIENLREIAENGNIKLHCFSPEEATMTMLAYGEQLNKDLLDRTLEKMLRYLKSAVYLYRELQASLSAGPIVHKANELGHTLEYARKALESRRWLGSDKVIYADSVQMVCNNTFVISPENGDLARAIDLLDPDEIRNAYYSQIHAAEDYLNQYPYRLRAVVMDLYLKCKYEAERIHSFTDMLPREMMAKKIRQVYDKEAILKKCLTIILEEIEKINIQKQSSVGEAVRGVTTYIEEHYAENVSIKEIANELFYNPVYLGTLFRKEVGQSFNAYLISFRMKKASDMMRNTSLPIKQIAGKVGYKDYRYFCKLFKTEIGIGPADYKKLHVSGIHREINDEKKQPDNE